MENRDIPFVYFTCDVPSPPTPTRSEIPGTGN